MIYKCKMCGGELDIAGKEHICECPFCGVTQTIPNVEEEKTLQLYNRATFLLKSCEYDKASSIYEKIIADQGEQAEAYWGLCLCKYGIEYVDDPKTGKKIPTCHRALTKSILKDSDYLKTLELADVIAKKLYKEEAEYIDTVQKKILEISKSEEPYDIFICYKETDKAGKRTLDSVLAEEIYDAFTEKGYRVFFSKISLEDKIGQEYEPFIFAALTSAKVMFAIGTKEEYFNAPWVKNEWSRFLKLCDKGEKKYLIPCYKDISPYEMPEEFVNLQAQDLGKLGYLQDLTKGINKLFEKVVSKQKDTFLKNEKDDLIHSTYKELRRMLLFVTDSDHFDQKTYTDKWGVLYTLEDPSNSFEPRKAPLAFACDFLYTNELPDFRYSVTDTAFDSIDDIESIDFKKLEKEEPELYKEIQQFLKDYSEHRDYLEKLKKYQEAIEFKNKATKPDDFIKLYQMFNTLGDFRNSKRQADFYKKKANSIFDSSLTELIYEKLIDRISRFNTKDEKEEILNGFNEIGDYKEAKKYIAAANHKDPVTFEKSISDLQSKKESLISNNSEINNLKDLIDNLNKELDVEVEKAKKILNDKKALLEKEIADIRKEYSDTSQKLLKCGLFAVKEKKLLRDKLGVLETELVKIKRENGRQSQNLESEFNDKNENLKSTYCERIASCEKQINQIIDSISEIKTIDDEIAKNEKELKLARKNEDDSSSLSKLWDSTNINVFYDHEGFKILTIKLGKFPQSKVVAPSLINELKITHPDEKGIYHLHGLEFFEINKNFYFIEPIKWKVLKYSCIDGKYHYLLTTKEVLIRKGPMNPENVVKVPHDDRPWEYFTKEENEYVSLYKYSDIRKWLINDFYAFAFNENEQKVICTALVDNSADSTSDETTIFATGDTEDKVFLLSYRACKKTHLGDDLYKRDNTGFSCMTEEKLAPILEKENSFVDNELIPSFGISTSDVQYIKFDEDRNKNRIYDDSNELCQTDLYSDYAFESKKALPPSSVGDCEFLLRSPDTENLTGYNTCTFGKVNNYGGQYEDGNFEVIDDILPCIILCLSENKNIVKPNKDFDF